MAIVEGDGCILVDGDTKVLLNGGFENNNPYHKGDIGNDRGRASSQSYRKGGTICLCMMEKIGRLLKERLKEKMTKVQGFYILLQRVVIVDLV